MDPTKPLTLHTPPALLIIDLQNSFVHDAGIFRKSGIQLPSSRITQIVQNINRLRRAFHAKSYPVIFASYAFDADYSNAGILFDDNPLAEVWMKGGMCVRGSWDAEVIEELRPDAGRGEVQVEKYRNSAFAAGTKLEGVLRERGVGTVVCCGEATNVCVESTVREGCGRDWRCVTVGDACAALTMEIHEASLANLQWFGGVWDTKDVEEALERIGK